MAHLDDRARAEFLSNLRAGSSLDLRGTRLNSDLLSAILNAVSEDDGRPVLGSVLFDEAEFSDHVKFGEMREERAAGVNETTRFVGAKFDGTASFVRAKFDRGAYFARTQFAGQALFRQATFSDYAWFQEAQFSDDATFAETQFHDVARFDFAHFSANARFEKATVDGVSLFSRARFDGGTWFNDTQFNGEARFDQARAKLFILFNGTKFGGSTSFSGMWAELYISFYRAEFASDTQLGPIFVGINAEPVFSGFHEQGLQLVGAKFRGAASIAAVAPVVFCVLASFADTTSFQLRYADVVMDSTVFLRPCTISYAEPFKSAADVFTPPAERSRPLFDEAVLQQAGYGERPRVVSLRQVDVSNLVLADLDLRSCRFGGAHNLDRLRIEGARPFADTPGPWRLRVRSREISVWRRWTRRQVLSEEHRWRSYRSTSRRPAKRRNRRALMRTAWYPPGCRPPAWFEQSGLAGEALRPDRLASLYRSLRKAEEDNKNEPGAADFYYGEMEMRRADPQTPTGERIILWLYWLFAGYGLRGLRALSWLAVTVFGAAFFFDHIGFSERRPRFADALLYAAESTVSIANDTPLTRWGAVLRIALRLAGPLLLGLTLLSVRNRVKR